jgi:DNA-binding GntR family transcriptional regulator
MEESNEQLSRKNSVNRQSLADEIYQLLYQRIISGEYEPGDWLRQGRISEELSVSHIPVREAMTRLESASLLERIPYRGMRVPEYNREQILDAYAVRLIFDVIVARLAAKHIGEAKLPRLRNLLEELGEMRSFEDIARHRQLNKRLHITIAESTRSPLLAKLYQLVSNQFPDWLVYETLIKREASFPSIFQREFDEHQELVDAISSHDPDLAERRAIEHLHSIGLEMEEMLNMEGQIISRACLQAIGSINAKSLDLMA